MLTFVINTSQLASIHVDRQRNDVVKETRRLVAGYLRSANVVYVPVVVRDPRIFKSEQPRPYIVRAK